MTYKTIMPKSDEPGYIRWLHRMIKAAKNSKERVYYEQALQRVTK